MPEEPPASSLRSDDSVAARIGTVLADKWTLERLLGAGAMAAVYVGRHKIGRRDAIKILHPEIASDEELAARFEQEAHAVNCLDHPGAVEIRDIGETAAGEPFLVMELLDGQSLAERIEAGPIERPEVLRIIDELLDVLVAAHAAEIIHRDIKPDNLLLLDDGRLKVLDFGIARVRRAGSRKVVTQLGAALGTPAYMPQEQIKGMDVDHRADLFAAGAVLFELLTGRRVHHGDNQQMVMVQMLTCPAPALASVAPELPADLCAVVDRALAFEAADRYPDAVTMQADVRALREGQTPPFASRSAAAARPGDTVARAPGTVDGLGVAATSVVGVSTAAAPTRTKQQPAPMLLALTAALGLTIGIIVVVWAASTGGPDTVEPTLDASTSMAPSSTPDALAPDGETSEEISDAAPDQTSAEISDAAPDQTSPPTGPSPRTEPDRKPDKERSKTQREIERQRKKLEKKLERERKKRDKKRRR